MRRVRSRGFTLVELAVVVVIVAILAVLGVVGYRRWTATAHMAEATGMVTSIKAAQEAHKSERGFYAKVSNAVDAYYPAAAPGKFTTQWGGPCSNCVTPNAWEKINVKTASPVMFGYATYAAVKPEAASMSGTAPAAITQAVGNSANLVDATPYYIVMAFGDTDGNGVGGYVSAYSWTNALVTAGEGE